MHDISDLNHSLPTNKQLIKASATAFVIASILLVIAILPAEYGIDPTGLGKTLGLTQLNSNTTEDTPKIVPELNPADAQAEVSAIQPLSNTETPYRSDTVTLPLAPGQGVELKAIMQSNDHFVFTWEAKGGGVYFDMHGDVANSKDDEFVSYQIEESLNKASGRYTAAFAGAHGWYWLNRGTEPVEINLSISGFYEGLYQP